MTITKKLTPELLDFWATNRYNVLFEGRHGVGKTAIVKECFTRNGFNWRYFSASTMDPWCDFVGIPRVVQNADGENQLEYVLPRDFSDDRVEALFFDEFNRSHKKVRDAVMELIQFKSINGRPFKNLKVVWAAINPPGEEGESSEYQVDHLDPALQDRFHIHVKVPFMPDPTFFRKKFGTIGHNAVDWWNELPHEIQSKISPRRMEYALEVNSVGGNMAFVLPREANVRQLETALATGTAVTVAKSLLATNDIKQAKAWLGNANNLDATVQLINKSKKAREFFIPLLPKENLVLAMSNSKKVCKFVMEKEATEKKYATLIQSIIDANQNRKLVRMFTNHRAKFITESAIIKDIDMVASGKIPTSKSWVMLESATVNIKQSKSISTETIRRKLRIMAYSAFLFLLSRSQYASVKYNYARSSKARKLVREFINNISASVRKTKYNEAIKSNKAQASRIASFNKFLGFAK